MKLYVRPTFDRTPLVKVTKAKLIELRNALKSGDDPISNATINTLFASLSSAYSYFVEQGWCSENPLRLIEDLEVAERPFTWLQSAGEVQKLLAACNDNIRTLVAVVSAGAWWHRSSSASTARRPSTGSRATARTSGW